MEDEPHTVNFSIKLIKVLFNNQSKIVYLSLITKMKHK